MELLIIDDDKALGGLLASACKKLGHRAEWVGNHEQAIESLRAHNWDAVFIDLEMPEGHGIEFAKRMHEENLELPIAFARGNAVDQELISCAEKIAPVLPKIWTRDALREVLSVVEEISQKLQGSNLPMPPLSDFAAEGTPLPPEGPPALPMTTQVNQGWPSDDGLSAPTARFKRREVEAPKVKIACSKWSQVRRLCDEVSRGLRTITVRAIKPLVLGGEVTVLLSLPDESVEEICSRVLSRGESKGKKCPYQLSLDGFGPQVMRRLLSLCDQHQSHRRASTYPEALESQTELPVPNETASVPDYTGEPKISWK